MNFCKCAAATVQLSRRVETWKKLWRGFDGGGTHTIILLLLCFAVTHCFRFSFAKLAEGASRGALTAYLPQSSPRLQWAWLSAQSVVSWSPVDSKLQIHLNTSMFYSPALLSQTHIQFSGLNQTRSWKELQFLYWTPGVVVSVVSSVVFGTVLSFDDPVLVTSCHCVFWFLFFFPGPISSQLCLLDL